MKNSFRTTLQFWIFSKYEKYHNVEISNDLLNLIIKLSNKYLKNRKNPDKTIDILDEVCAHAGIKENKEMILYRNLTKDLKHVLEQKKTMHNCK